MKAHRFITIIACANYCNDYIFIFINMVQGKKPFQTSTQNIQPNCKYKQIINLVKLKLTLNNM